MKKPLTQLIRLIFYAFNSPYLKWTSIICLFLFISAAADAQVIKGKIFDSKTGEPLAGATVKIEQGAFKQFTSAKLDGSYAFKNLHAGTYQVTAAFISYAASPVYEVIEKSDNDVEVKNIYLNYGSTQINEVVVTGAGNKTSDRNARGIEKNAPSVENVLSQNTIQLLPDVTVGNAMQRVSGVTIQRSTSGEGRYAVIRGMDQRYNNVLVNGIKIPSPDNQYRFVPLDIFPSEMLERLEVIKALTPSMEGDAIGGTMNLVMKTAPDRFILNVDAAAGYSFLFSDNRPFSSFEHSTINKKSPAELHGNDYVATASDFPVNHLNYTPKNNPVNQTFGITVGDRFLDHKLGVIVSASYQNFYRGSNSDFLIQNAEPSPTPAPNTPILSDVYTRYYSTQTNRVGLHNKIDYVFNKKNKISFYNLYIHQNELQTRYTADTVLITNTSAVSKEVDISNRSRWTYQSVYNGTLQGDHQITDKFKFNWSGVYSIAKSAVPDMAEYGFVENVHLGTSGNVTSVDSTTKSMSRIWQHNSDKDLAGYYNFTYTPKIASEDVEFSIGGLYRHKTRNNYYADYTLDPPAGSPEPFHNINSATYDFTVPANGSGNNTTVSANDYTVYENITAEYLQAKFMLGQNLQVLGGVRVENTAQNYLTVQPLTSSGRSGNINYTDVLPSANLKYTLTSNQNLRLSYFKSISRPAFNEIVPITLPGEYFDEVGNPYLKHIKANNYDFRYELYPGGADQILLGAFYKDIKDPIEYVSVNGESVQFFKEGGPSAQFIQPQNRNKATNYGAEAQFTKFFGVIGISGNYTYTHSAITTSKLIKEVVNNTSVKDSVNQTRPLQGQAQNIGNLSLLFKSTKLGLNMQLAYVYTGERIAQVSNFYNLDIWQHPYSQLDFSFEKTLVKKLSLYGKINNLTNASNSLFLKHSNAGQVRALPDQETASQIQVEKDIYKVSFLGGLRYKF
ncbi:TonB-dependent receptor domain-containing protein [Mucilaginibacter sp.]|uniref:TonB-dependent receptor n=1 Tax=Mucilaginibacter sp. TaxID=1882438 RepID=UPI003D12B946